MSTLNKFKSKFPNIHIDIILEELSVLEERSKVGKLDILIKNDYEHFDNFTNIKSFTINEKLIASKKHFLELENKELSLDELLTYPLVLLSNITHVRRNFDAFLKSKNKEIKPTYEFNSYSLCKELIKNGFGIGVGNPIHYESDDFIVLKTNFDLPAREFNIGYINKSKNKLIKEFIQLIEN